METIDTKIRNAYHVLTRMYAKEAVMEGGSISISQFIAHVDSKEGGFASQIAPKLGMEITSLSRILQTMEEKKMIKRSPDKDDGRRTKITLTPKGVKHKEFSDAKIDSINKALEKKIGKKKIQDLMMLLDELVSIANDRIENND